MGYGVVREQNDPQFQIKLGYNLVESKKNRLPVATTRSENQRQSTFFFWGGGGEQSFQRLQPNETQ